mmetsp:Transcript_17817/g.25058  ORF Transcript_17817/g.25058 Transcript_17817/m.25058 type:complete len:156 (+) Transcript_17817:9-476(+)
MSNTKPIEAHHVKKGTHVMLKGRPCKAVDVKTSKTGKHGHAKCNITGIDVLNSKKYNEVHPGHIVLATFDVDKRDYEVMELDEKESCVKCLDENGEETTIDFTEENSEMTNWAEFQEDATGAQAKVWSVTVISAPVGETEPPLVSMICEVKEVKD